MAIAGDNVCNLASYCVQMIKTEHQIFGKIKPELNQN